MLWVIQKKQDKINPYFHFIKNKNNFSAYNQKTQSIEIKSKNNILHKKYKNVKKIIDF